MNHSKWIGVLAAGPVLALAACGSSGGSASAGGNTSSSTPAPTTHAAKVASHGSGLHVANSSLGRIVVDGSGMTLYLLTSDKPNDSRCNAACLHYWPLVPASQGAHARGVTAKVSSTKATDGKQLVTVGGWPLYTYVQDHSPGDVTGQGLKSFGGVWYVISPSGQPIKGSAMSSSGSTGGGGYGY
ncbi:MAG TPA: hypothetical protein VFJ12_02540 [Segeticoccus sp.]|nr:hypothetical protein [Segeticoccus sp.]